MPAGTKTNTLKADYDVQGVGLLLTSTIATEKSARIFGGAQVQPGELPFNALIELTKQDNSVRTSCGSVLSMQWILTSSSSVQQDSTRPGAFTVFAGKYDLLQREASEQSLICAADTLPSGV
ncbi:hypothetical protein quinque_016194 [Culex quinquefasciatus]